MSKPQKINQNVNLMNSIESLYASWYRNLIITIGAGLLLYIQFIKMRNEKLINNKFKIIIYMFIVLGIITGVYYTKEYYKKIEYIKKNDINGLLNIYLDNYSKTIIAAFLITLYIFTLYYIIKHSINKNFIYA